MQIYQACEFMKLDPRISQGSGPIILIGTSVGGLIARGVRQMCDIGKRVFQFHTTHPLGL